MDKENYIKKIDEIKASDALKQRIIKKVSEDDMKSNNYKSLALFAGITAAVSIALIGLVIGINISKTQKPTQQVPAKTTSDTNATTSETTVFEAPTGEYYTHEILKSDVITDKIRIGRVFPGQLNGADFSLQIEFTNISTNDMYIDPNFWVEVINDKPDGSGSSYTEVQPDKTRPVSEDTILAAYGEKTILDFTEEFKNYYSYLLSEDNSIFIYFNVTSNVNGINEKSTERALITIIPDLTFSSEKQYLPYGTDKLFLEITNSSDSSRSYTLETRLKKYDFSTLDTVYIDVPEHLTKLTIKSGETIRPEIDIPSNLSPGIYCIESTIYNNNRTMANNYTPFIISAPNSEYLSLNTNKNIYNSNENITATLKVDNLDIWKFAKFTAYSINYDGSFEKTVSFDNSTLSISNNTETITLKPSKKLETGNYILVVEIDDGSSISAVVGEMHLNEITLVTEFEIK